MILKNYNVIKNKSLIMNFIIKDNDGNIIDISGKTGSLKIYLDIPESNNTFVIDKSITLTNAEKGECSVELDDSDTDINPAVYKYYLQILMDTGENVVYYYGSFEVIGDDTYRLKQIRDIYGLEFDNYILQNALNYAHTEMLKDGFEKVELETTTSDNVLKIKNYVMDSNFDGIVDKNDLDIIQYQRTSPYTVQDLNSNISGVTFNHPNGHTIVTMDDNYPSNSYTLRVTYYKGINTYSNLKQNINRIEELYTLIYLFENLSPYKLQRGLKSRSINGIEMTFDQDGVIQMLKSLKMQKNTELTKIKPIKTFDVLISKKYREAY